MNDLMTRSLLGYAELQRQAQKDLEAQHGDHLGHFFQEVNSIKDRIEEIANLISNLENLSHFTNSRDHIESDVLSVLHKANIVKSSIQSLEKQCTSGDEGDVEHRTMITVVNALRLKLRGILNDFQFLRQRILSDCSAEENRNPDEQNDAVMDLRRSLTRLHQVFLDMAVLVDSQGENIDDIEENMTNARQYIAGGTDGLYYANQMKKKSFSLWWILLAIFIILLVCLVSSLAR